jgi:hypothetical protein
MLLIALSKVVSTQNEAKITNDFKIGINTVKALRRRANAMMRISIVGLALLLAACDDEGSPAAPAASVSSWKIAYSPNMQPPVCGCFFNRGAIPLRHRSRISAGGAYLMLNCVGENLR